MAIAGSGSSSDINVTAEGKGKHTSTTTMEEKGEEPMAIAGSGSSSDINVTAKGKGKHQHPNWPKCPCSSCGEEFLVSLAPDDATMVSAQRSS